MPARSPYPRMIAATLALLGLLDAAYLTLDRYEENVGLVCPVGGGCETVQNSAWSTLPPGDGVPVALIGVVGYATLLGLALAGLHRERLGRLAFAPALLAASSAGLLFALYLTALQIFVIGALCSWCLASATLQLGIWLAALTEWRTWRGAPPDPQRWGGREGVAGG